MKPPIYVKHNNPSHPFIRSKHCKFALDGPFVTPGDAQMHVANCDYDARRIGWELVDRAAWLAWVQELADKGINVAAPPDVEHHPGMDGGPVEDIDPRFDGGPIPIRPRSVRRRSLPPDR